jgi:squalene-hopene/tetraprenyl-beta-curcumene cyclase
MSSLPSYTMYDDSIRNQRTAMIDHSITEALQWLETSQSQEGFWSGILESNVCIDSEWLLAMHLLGIETDAKKPGLVHSILESQRRDGAWETYYDAPQGDINATVEAYAALRAGGLSPDSEPLKKARAWIFAHGGLKTIRVFTRYWLAMIGEWPWDKTPNIPPEIIFFPRWFPFNIYHFASWARGTILPLSILSARRTVRPLPSGCRLDELFPLGRDATDYDLPPKNEADVWQRLFKSLDRLLHCYQRFGWTPARETAVRVCLEWIIKHQNADGALCGIQPPWIYSLLALHAEGYPVSHPILRSSLEALDRHWSYEWRGGVRIRASESPVWDTLLVLTAMQDCGRDYRRSGSMQQAVSWILSLQIKEPGDWQNAVRGVLPGGWAFQRCNRAFPDIDDTAVALSVLARLRPVYPDRKRLEEAISLALRWVCAMQCRNGGWGAFDKDNDKAILTKIPFCDFGETLDPPSVDVTAHVVEAFGHIGLDMQHPVVQRGVAFIRKEQEPDGSWFGRWGVNYIYGTSAVLQALAAVNEDMNAGYVRRAAAWITDHQNPDGGWGESCASYMDPAWAGKGVSTASQTAWALMALLAVEGSGYRHVIECGVDYLTAHQHAGTWDEPQFTGTGFPGYGVGGRVDLKKKDLCRKLHQGAELSRGFMLNYGLYRHYFPLMALARARLFLQGRQASLETRVPLGISDETVIDRRMSSFGSLPLPKNW